MRSSETERCSGQQTNVRCTKYINVHRSLAKLDHIMDVSCFVTNAGRLLETEILSGASRSVRSTQDRSGHWWHGGGDSYITINPKV